VKKVNHSLEIVVEIINKITKQFLDFINWHASRWAWKLRLIVHHGGNEVGEVFRQKLLQKFSIP